MNTRESVRVAIAGLITMALCAAGAYPTNGADMADVAVTAVIAFIVGYLFAAERADKGDGR